MLIKFPPRSEKKKMCRKKTKMNVGLEFQLL